MADTFKTIQAFSEGFYRDRGSKFHAYAYPVRSESEINTCLEGLRKEHPKARHHCYAWRLGTSGTSYRANDDGEPSGTAGRPILGQIDSAGLTNVLIVVVRYFGGTLLGAAGLIEAYKVSARDAIEQATVVEQPIQLIYKVDFQYGAMNDLMTLLKKQQIDILEKDFSGAPYLIMALLPSKTYIAQQAEEIEGVMEVIELS